MLEAFFALLSTVLFQTSAIDGGKGSFPHPLTSQEEKELLEKYHSGDSAALDILVNHNMRLVVHVVKKYNNYPDPDELVSVGAMGLVKSIKTFAGGKGTQLATYAARCIENEILMTLRSTKKLKNNRSLYEPIGHDKDGNEIALIDLLSTEEDCVTKIVDDTILKERMAKILNSALDKRELDIITMRYGFNDSPIYTQIEVAKRLEISRSYISRIEKRALLKLREYLTVHKIDLK